MMSFVLSCRRCLYEDERACEIPTLIPELCSGVLSTKTSAILDTCTSMEDTGTGFLDFFYFVVTNALATFSLRNLGKNEPFNSRSSPPFPVRARKHHYCSGRRRIYALWSRRRIMNTFPYVPIVITMRGRII